MDIFVAESKYTCYHCKKFWGISCW